MHLFEGLATTSTLFVFVATSPVNLQPRAGNFIVHQTVPKPFKKSGPAEILSTYGKYNASAPENVVNAAYANDGIVLADPTRYDIEYLSPVTIGGQTLTVNFDTGSSDFWVYSSYLSTTQTDGHSIYNPAQSSTSRVLDGYTWEIIYGDGSGARGRVGTDTVKIGTTTVTNQAVELADDVSLQFQGDILNDGVLGLGFDSINSGELFAILNIITGSTILVQPVRQKTFFSNAKASLSAPLFTANLKRGQPGSYTFGFINAAEHTSSITYVPVDSDKGFWGLTINGYAVGTAAFKTSSFKAVADTGTTLLFLPDTIVRAYYRSVRDSGYNYALGGYTYPCSVTLPSLTLGIGSYKAVIPGSYVTFQPVDSELCYGGIQPSDGIGIAVFGGIFLKSQFVVFQSSPLQLGFATKPLYSV
ncbi:MAG: hypothetical protein LQ337_006203 [Flavoplaca oasis]|nr:MAG: hypothetical protein LQ337_006203 [Flavoplaca oasis]